jgi:amino acid adenylation domain-containing protein
MGARHDENRPGHGSRRAREAGEDRSPSAAPGQGLSCFLIGGTTLLTRCADLLLRSGWCVLGVVTSDRQTREWAEGASVPRHAADQEWESRLAAREFDYLFSVVNPHILRKTTLALPHRGAVNYHDSLLPAHAGVHAPSWAMIAGETEHGVTWHLVDEGIDSGAILAQAEVEISRTDTALTLHAKCYEAALSSFEGLIGALEEGRAAPRLQDPARRTYHGLRDRPPSAGIIAFDESAESIHAMVRALDFGGFYPNPLGSPKLWVDGHLAIVEQAVVLPGSSSPLPGTVSSIRPDRIVFATATRDLAITRLKTPDGIDLAPGEFAARAGLREGEAPPPLPAASRTALEGTDARMCRDERFWVERLLDFRPLPLLPFLARSPNADGDGGPVAVELGSLGTDFPSGLALLGGLVGRLAGADEFDLGCLDRASEPLALELAVPCVPLRIAIPEGGTVASLREQIAAALAELGEHPGYARDIVDRYPQLRGHAAALHSDLLAVRAAVVRREEELPSGFHRGLTFLFSPDDRAWRLIWRSDLVVGARVEQFTELLAAFRRSVSEDPARSIHTTPLLDPPQRERILHEWNRATVPYPTRSRVHDLFARWAEETPEHAAVVHGGVTLSYRELRERAGAGAQRLVDRGIGPGDIVGLCLDRTEEMIVGMLAVLEAGGAYLPMDPAYPAERLRFMLSDSGAQLLVTSEAYATLFDDATVPVLLHGAEDDPLPPSPRGARAEPKTSNLAYVIYTSGSTGRPKGVMISHRNVVAFLYSYAEVTGQSSGRIGTTVASFSFDTSVEEIYSCLCFGGTVHIIDPGLNVDAVGFARYLRDEAITITYIVPAMLSAVATELARIGCPPTLRCVLTGLAAKKQEDLQGYRNLSPNLRIINAYGPTEVTYGATAFRFDSGEDPRDDVPIGRPFPNYQVYVVDSHLQPVPVGVPGELLIGGVGLSSGYLGREDLNAEKFLPHPFSGEAGSRVYRTGDRVVYRADGNIEFLGRFDDQVKIRGFRVEPAEIESILDGHPRIDAAVVQACEFGAGDVRLVAYLVATGEEAIPRPELREFLGRDLPDHMVPSHFVFLDELPRMPNDKIDKARLPVPELRREELDSPYDPPLSDSEAEMCRMWESCLRFDPIGVRDNFFDLGGDSLLAAALLSEIEIRLGVKLTLATLFHFPTVRDLLEHLGGRPEAPTTSGVSSPLAIPVQPEGRLPPLFLIHGWTSLNHARQLSARLDDRPVYLLREGLSEGIITERRDCSNARIRRLSAEYLETVRSLQATGPYHLCGYSVGGLVAFEIAQRLREAGEEIELLGLVDSLNGPVHLQRSFRLRHTPLRRLVARLWSRPAPSRPAPAPASASPLADPVSSEPYIPAPYGGDVLFIASEEGYRGIPTVKAWEPVVRGKLETIIFPGDHFSLMEAPSIGRVHERICDHLPASDGA